MRKTRLMTALTALGFAATSGAFAQADYRAYPWRGDFWGYLGASGGESKYRTDCQQGVTRFFDCDLRDTGFKVYAGGRMNEVFGLEVGYTDFGHINASGGETQAWAVPVTLVAGVPLGSRFGIFGKIGGLYGRTDVTADLDELFQTGHKSGWGWTYGAGATFAVTPSVDIRADFDRYKLDFVGGRRDVDMISAGVQVRF
jgi:opacity protein-like surface antigen